VATAQPTTVVATDLDRTLIYSMAAIESTMNGVVPALLCVEMYDGKPLSYMTIEAARLLELVRSNAVLVPTTTRTPA